MNRKSLREQTFKLLFRAEFNSHEEMSEQADMFFNSGDLTVTQRDQEFIVGRCTEIIEKLPEIDALLDEKLRGWDHTRIGKVELAILRQAVYEIVYDESIPAGVSINEAVDLAKKFGQENSGVFINGVLARFAGKEDAPAADSSAPKSKKRSEGKNSAKVVVVKHSERATDRKSFSEKSVGTRKDQ